MTKYFEIGATYGTASYGLSKEDGQRFHEAFEIRCREHITTLLQHWRVFYQNLKLGHPGDAPELDWDSKHGKDTGN